MFGTTQDFGPYGPQHGLIITDMQEMSWHGVLNWEFRIKKLTQNIQRHLRACLAQGGPVVIIEYRERGPTIEPIRKIIDTAREQVIILQKNNWGLFTRNDPERKKQIEYFSQAQSSGTRFTEGGVNTSICCLSVAISLLERQVGVRVLAGITMNIGDNSLKSIVGFFKKYPGLLDLPGNPEKKESLLDYL